MTVRNLCKIVGTGNRYGIPTPGVTAVDKELTRDALKMAYMAVDQAALEMYNDLKG